MLRLGSLHQCLGQGDLPCMRTRQRYAGLQVRIVALAAALVFVAAECRAQIRADKLLKSLQPTADVNDYAGILSAAEKESLEQKCRELREKTGAQLAVVILKSLQGGQIDDFAVKLFKRWGIGQKDKKNGALLLVALDDHKAR